MFTSCEHRAKNQNIKELVNLSKCGETHIFTNKNCMHKGTMSRLNFMQKMYYCIQQAYMETPLETHCIYSGNKDIYCLLKI
jgi:hypothetical protein